MTARVAEMAPAAAGIAETASPMPAATMLMSCLFIGSVWPCLPKALYGRPLREPSLTDQSLLGTPDAPRPGDGDPVPGLVSSFAACLAAVRIVRRAISAVRHAIAIPVASRPAAS